MKISISRAFLALAASASLLLAACGGSDDPPAAAGASDPAVTFSGTAATGAAFTGAIVTVIDSRGTQVGTSSPVSASGTYTVTLSPGALAPFVLVATRSVPAPTRTLVSVADTATTSHVNITPITDLIASRLSPSGYPQNLSRELASGTAQITPAKVAAAIAEIRAILAPVLAATGQSSANPITTTFATDGTGHDLLLDSLTIDIALKGSGSTTEITVKTSTPSATGTTPVIQYGNTQTVADITATNNISSTSIGSTTVTSSNLAEPGMSALISGLLSDMTACHAVPLVSRVAGGSVTTAVTGTASAIIAPACKAIFMNAAPADYLDNGMRVGRDANGAGAFESIFRSFSAVTASFVSGAFEYTRANGDHEVSFQMFDGVVLTPMTAVVRKQSDGKLRLVGNQYTESGAVTPHHEFRSNAGPGQSLYDYHSTGYTLYVASANDGAGSSRYDRVEVTMPSGQTVTLKPNVGYPHLALANGPTQISRGNFLRLAASFVAGAQAGYESPAQIEAFETFALATLTEPQVQALAARSNWTFRYFNAGNTGMQPDVVQTYRTRAKPLTLTELRSRANVGLTASMQMYLTQTVNVTTGELPVGTPTFNIAAPGSPADAWTVPSGATAPFAVRAWGRGDIGTGTAYNWQDEAQVLPAQRSTAMPCSRSGTTGDTHCLPDSSFYNPGLILNAIGLVSRDAQGREFTVQYMMRRTSPNN